MCDAVLLVLCCAQCWKSFVDEEWAVKEKEVAARVCIEVSLLQCRELLRASRGSVDDAVSNLDKGLINMVVTSAGIDSTSNVEPDKVLATIEMCKGDIDEAIAQVSEQVMMRAAATFCSSTILTAFTSAWRGRARRDAALRDAVSAFSAKIAVARAQRLVKDAAEWLFALISMKLASKRYAQLRVAKAIPNILSGKLRQLCDCQDSLSGIFPDQLAGCWSRRVACSFEEGQGAERESAEG